MNGVARHSEVDHVGCVMNLTRIPEQVVSAVIGAGESDRLSGLPAGSTGLFSVLPTDFRDGGSPPVSNPDWGAAMEDPVVARGGGRRGSSTGDMPPWLTYTLIGLVVLFLVWIVYSKYMAGRRPGPRRAFIRPRGRPE